MDILLIDPPYYSLKGIPNDVGYNLGLTSLAAYLRKKGFDCAVLMGDHLVDFNFVNSWGWFTVNFSKYAEAQRKYWSIVEDNNHPVWRRIAAMVKEKQPKAVGIMYLTPFRYAVERVARTIKELDPTIKIIVGSAHPTVCPDEVMLNPDFDFVVRGEGEIPLAGIAEQLRMDKPNWSSVPGIYYRDKSGHVVNTPLPKPIADLDELPFVARDLVLACDYNRFRVHCLTTARGCPYACSFCSDRTLWGGGVRRRSVENVISELKYLEQNFRVDMVIFSDGTFTYDRKYVEEFCQAVHDHKISLRWQCTARYDNLDEKLIKIMKDANCDGLYLGAESGSDRILSTMDKKITAAQIMNISVLVRKAGLNSVNSILFGLPNETKEDIEATLYLMSHIKTGGFDVNNFIPLPGTPAWNMLSDSAKEKIDWRKISYKSVDNYFLSDISMDEFRDYMEKAYRIAAKTHHKTVIRLGIRKGRDYIKNLFSR